MSTTLTANDRIKQRIEEFTIELADLVRHAAMESVQEAFGAYGSLTPARPSRTQVTAPKATAAATPKTPSGKRIRRTPEDIEKLSNTVVSFVGKHPGSRLEDISAGTGIASKELKKPVADLLAAKHLTKEGQKRGTSYWVVTK